jgi:hypothetical protein
MVEKSMTGSAPAAITVTSQAPSNCGADDPFGVALDRELVRAIKVAIAMMSSAAEILLPCRPITGSVKFLNVFPVAIANMRFVFMICSYRYERCRSGFVSI